MQKVAFYILSLLAIGVSAFTCFNFLEPKLGLQSAAIGAALLLAICTHAFSAGVIKFANDKRKRITPHLLTFLLLAAVGTVIDFAGSDNFTHKGVLMVKEKYNSDIAKKRALIAKEEEVIVKCGDWATGKKKDWGKQSQLIFSEGRIKQLNTDIAVLKQELKTKAASLTAKAETDATRMKGGVVAAYLIMLLASWGLSYKDEDEDGQPKAVEPKVEAVEPKVETVEAVEHKVEAVETVEPKVEVVEPKVEVVEKEVVMANRAIEQPIKFDSLADQYPIVAMGLKQGLALRKAMALGKDQGEVITYYQVRKLKEELT